MDNNFNFNICDVSDDDIINIINKSKQITKTEVSILNTLRVKAVACVYNILKDVVKGTNTKVLSDFTDINEGYASISVIGDSISFKNTAWLSAISKFASNFNVYTTKDNKVQIDYMFYGLSDRI